MHSTLTMHVSSQEEEGKDPLEIHHKNYPLSSIVGKSSWHKAGKSHKTDTQTSLLHVQSLCHDFQNTKVRSNRLIVNCLLLILIIRRKSKNVVKKLKDVEISVPIVYGNIAFWLGKKASEYQSHRWTVYVRGATNEDLSVVVKRVVFQLHSSFNNPMRVVESPPFELSESGWGEFEIAITLHFHTDVSEKPLHLYHHLKLYPEDDSGSMSVKRPVVVESYDEVVFAEPSEALFARVQNHPAVVVPRLPAGISLPSVPAEDADKRKRFDPKDNPLTQWFTNFSEADELLKLAAARQQVQTQIARVRRQLSLIDGQHQQQLKPPSEL